MNDADLIELVRNYEELYNLRHQLYSSQPRRDIIWDEIGEQLAENAETCRARWHKIRENYRKALILRKTRTGKAADKLKPPKFHRELSFLIPYLNDEETRRSSVPDVLRPNRRRDTSPDYVSDSLGGGDSNSDSSVHNKTSHTQKRRLSASSRPLPSSVDQPSVPKQYLPKKTQPINSETDTLTDFFVTMAKTVAKFPLKKQLEIKSQLFQMVLKEELASAEECTSETVFPPQTSFITQPVESTPMPSIYAVSNPVGNEIQIRSYESILPPTEPTTSEGSPIFVKEEMDNYDVI